MNKNLFPVFINIEGKKTVVIGGGKVAERKVSDLLQCDAQVVVISPQVTNIIADWADKGYITWLRKDFEDGDLLGACLAFLATDNSLVNRHVANICREQGILVNAVDDPENCDFYIPAVLRRQSLAVAISTGGKSPLLARKIKEDLEEVITEAYGEFAEILGEQREIILSGVPDIRERKKLFEALVYSDILALIKVGEKEKARERINSVCLAYGVKSPDGSVRNP
jgi:precorrin-2 dehydrogenase/sirohydrochlorin ferrochelatase